ncbi:MAG: carbohydrate kinase family protein [Candidatus Riflebacteria bacterium]|nr:carbohydrate kinase family protein [Candidatus Riflebacteria bacterium]
MTRILVSGLINVETTVRVEGFPLQYNPVNYPFHGVDSTVSGVGYNVAKALTVLGDRVDFLSVVGRDLAAKMVFQALSDDGLQRRFVVPATDRTAQSAILYDPAGRRQIHVDLKDVQEAVYPVDLFELALDRCSLAVLCNINFSRPFLAAAAGASIPIATDVHAISDVDDAYNRDFMRSARILFLSDEHLPCPPEQWVHKALERYSPAVIVVGLGAAGALLAVPADGFVGRFPAVAIRPVVNTIGAGDALFSCFVHAYARSNDPYEALRKAQVFASHKIGEKGAADGFLDAAALAELDERLRA